MPEWPLACTLARRSMAARMWSIGRRLADAGRVVVDQVALEVAHLIVVEHHLGELSDAGIDAVHDLVRREALLR